jgi:hypothetical protein
MKAVAAANRLFAAEGLPGPAATLSTRYDDTPVPGGDVRKRGREELVRNRGRQFDPNVVDAILAVAA